MRKLLYSDWNLPSRCRARNRLGQFVRQVLIIVTKKSAVRSAIRPRKGHNFAKNLNPNNPLNKRGHASVTEIDKDCVHFFQLVEQSMIQWDSIAQSCLARLVFLGIIVAGVG